MSDWVTLCDVTGKISGHGNGGLANNVEYTDRGHAQACQTCSPKSAHSHGVWAPSNTWFLELHESKHQVEISIGWTVLQDSSDKQTHTDRPRYSVCSNKPHLTDAAVQPNNSNLLILSPTKVVTLDMLTKVESTDKLSLEVAPTPLSLFAVSNLSLLFSRSCRSQLTNQCPFLFWPNDTM